MEKLPIGERPEPKIVGSGSPEAKEAARLKIVERFGKDQFTQFNEKELAELKAEEREKNDEERENIRVANEITNEILREFGLKEFDVPPENIHFILGKLWERLSLDDAIMITAPKKQAIFVKADYSPQERVSKALSLFHEMIHAKGHISLEVESDKRNDLYRSGLVAYASYQKIDRSGYAVWFDGLNEAVVSQIETMYADRVLNGNPFLRDQVEYLCSEEARKMKDDYAKEHDVDPSEINWIGRDGEESEVHEQSYRRQREVLNYVVDQIYADGGFASRSDVMRVFFGAHFKDSILPIGRLVEKSFGAGAFEFLGTMERNHNSPSVGRVLDFLMSRRRERLSSGISQEK
jgi:hypothetical protein